MTLDELERLEKAATPGPWYPTMTSGAGGHTDIGHGAGPEHKRPNLVDWHPLTIADAALIAALRNAAP